MQSTKSNKSLIIKKNLNLNVEKKGKDIPYVKQVTNKDLINKPISRLRSKTRNEVNKQICLNKQLTVAYTNTEIVRRKGEIKKGIG